MNCLETHEVDALCLVPTSESITEDRYYGKAINLCRLLRAAYDKVLNDYDLLAMPTTIKAQPHASS